MRKPAQGARYRSGIAAGPLSSPARDTPTRGGAILPAAACRVRPGDGSYRAALTACTSPLVHGPGRCSVISLHAGSQSSLTSAGCSAIPCSSSCSCALWTKSSSGWHGMTSHLRNLAMGAGSRHPGPPGVLARGSYWRGCRPRAGGRETRRWAPGHGPTPRVTGEERVIVGFLSLVHPHLPTGSVGAAMSVPGALVSEMGSSTFPGRRQTWSPRLFPLQRLFVSVPPW